MKENFTFEEVVNLIETHFIDNERPWDDWFNNYYCSDCPSIVKKESPFGREIDVPYSYCELHNECRYFGHMVDEKELVEQWLRHLTMPPIPYLGEVDYGDNFEKQKDALMNEYGITANHAGCYLVNFCDEYICKAYNGGCPRLEVCGKIEESEETE